MDTTTLTQNCSKHVSVLEFSTTLNDLRYNIKGVKKLLGRKLPTLIGEEVSGLENCLAQINSVDRSKFQHQEDWRHWFTKTRESVIEAVQNIINAVGSLTAEAIESLDRKTATRAAVRFMWDGEVSTVKDVAFKYITSTYVGEVIVAGKSLDTSLTAYCMNKTEPDNVIRIMREVVSALKNSYKGIPLRNRTP